MHPKSNIVYRGNCSTKGGRLIRTLSKFDHGFRDQNVMYLENFCNRLVGPCLKIVFGKYHVPALRNKKVVRIREMWSMTRKFWNDEIFKKIDAADGFRLLNS